MGLEATYQALPASSPLLARVREDVRLGEWFAHVPFWIRTRRERGLSPGTPDPGELQLWELVGALLRDDPLLATRSCDLDRTWDVLHYVLSAHRRDEPGTEEDTLADMAIRGEAPIADHVRAGQGALVRHTRPESVARISRLLDARPFEALGEHFIPERMEAAGVYKFGGPDEAWEHYRPRFESLRAFYRAAAEHGDDVIVCLD